MSVRRLLLISCFAACGCSSAFRADETPTKEEVDRELARMFHEFQMHDVQLEETEPGHFVATCDDDHGLHYHFGVDLQGRTLQYSGLAVGGAAWIGNHSWRTPWFEERHPLLMQSWRVLSLCLYSLGLIWCANRVWGRRRCHWSAKMRTVFLAGVFVYAILFLATGCVFLTHCFPDWKLPGI